MVLLIVGYSGPNFGNTAECFRNPNPMHPMHEAVQRELEKEQIREEIIAAEKARRRALEEEVRREMMLEREMALRRGGGDGFAIFSGFEPRHSVMQHQFEGRLLEERIVSAIEERFSSGGRRAGIGGGFETVPFQRIAEPKVTEVKPTSEVCKEKVIFLVSTTLVFFGPLLPFFPHIDSLYCSLLSFILFFKKLALYIIQQVCSRLSSKYF